jgi:hypothetical protein
MREAFEEFDVGWRLVMVLVGAGSCSWTALDDDVGRVDGVDDCVGER